MLSDMNKIIEVDLGGVVRHLDIDSMAHRFTTYVGHNFPAVPQEKIARSTRV